MGQAKMPPERMAPTLGYMIPGSSVWVTPWTLVVDEDSNIWVDANCALRDSPRGGSGTAQLHLTRDDNGAFHATLYNDHQYLVTPREKIALGNYLPVSTFTTETQPQRC